MKAKNHPGVYVPPPLIYVACFFLSILLQNILPLDKTVLTTTPSHMIGWMLIGLCLAINVSAIGQFVISKNTVVTIKPATSLQTTGIYSFTRNPMYMGLLLLYSGIACFKGNWWTFSLIPFLIMVIQLYVIRKEEQYLHEAFGSQYEAYKKKVRRWI